MSKSSVQAWTDASEITLPVRDGTLEIKLRQIDPIGWMTTEAGNPLLSVVSAMVVQGGGQESLGNIDGEQLSAIAKTLNKLAIETVVEPPLIEAGHEGGISVNAIRFEEKMQILEALMGGGVIDQASRFPDATTADMAVTPASD